MSFPRYPKYKPSGVEWLGEVPEHWDVVALKRIASLKSGDTITGESIEDTGSYPVLGGNGLRGFTSSFTHDGHFVVVGRQGALCGNINYATGKFWASEHAVVASPLKPVETVWLGEMLRAMNLNQYSVSAAQPGLSMEFVGNLRTIYPPMTDQTRIASFLARETAKIDGLVGEQRRLIELLKEKRQAVISHAVTKGLNPHAPLKPSGIEWLGEVPEHWVITPLKWLTDPDRPIMYGIVLPGPDVGDGVPILKGGNVKPSRMNLQSMARTTPEIEARYARSRLKEGDLVYSIRGSIGDCEPVPADLEGSNITQDVARVAVAARVCVSWVRWALLASAIRDDLACGSLGAAVRGINIFDLKRANVPTPPASEQVAIAEFIDRETSKLDALTAEAERAIELLQERRTALISTAVTGKIDVRGLATTEGL